MGIVCYMYVYSYAYVWQTPIIMVSFCVYIEGYITVRKRVRLRAALNAKII